MNPQGDCSVCTDISTDENPICVCADCSIKVHVLCYGIENVGESWKCSPCISGIVEPQCKLCLQKKGVFKKTSCGGFVHVICALFTEGVVFEDTIAMEPANISKVPKSMRNKECSFCLKPDGFCPHCSNYKCKNRIHISCAQRNVCLKEDTKSDGSLKFRAYCLDHKPKKNSRRISSVFVITKRMAAKDAANKRKHEKEKSSAVNSNWIISESNGENREETFQHARKSIRNFVSDRNKTKIGQPSNGSYHDSLDSVDKENYMAFIGLTGKGSPKQPSMSISANTNNTNEIDLINPQDNRSSPWDSYNLQSATTKNDESEKKSISPSSTESHVCCKDAKIAKVSVSFHSSTLHNKLLFLISFFRTFCCDVKYFFLLDKQIITVPYKKE